MAAEVTITYKGVTITTEGSDGTNGAGLAGMIARLVYMHDLDNVGQDDLQIGPKLKTLLDNKYGNQPKAALPIDPRYGR